LVRRTSFACGSASAARSAEIRRPLADWVLANFRAHEHAEEIVASAADAVETLVAEGCARVR
jgi:hypothetical protein